ncbi:MAG: D-xylose transport system substrate-binding protein [Chloroflexota bacterium]|nr:D-xylose transport system substrate-binding protein [Chloroflexota bacterium]
MTNRRFAATLGVIALVLAACTGNAGSSAPAASEPAASEPAASASAATGDCIVGVSWNNYQEERWALRDEPAIQAALDEVGAEYISADAGSSEEQQATDVENLLSQGANVIIILAQNTETILPSVQAAVDQGVAVIGYDRLIESPDALYVSFDNVAVGKLQAEAVLEQVSEGNFVIIKGNGADANSDFLRDGYVEAGIPAEGESSDTITIVGETYTDNWDPATAQTEMEQFLTENNNGVDAVLSENDGMAGGVVAALEAQGLAGQIPVSGQDGDLAALNRVALGTQTVDVWKDARELGKAAGEAAVALCDNPDLSAVAGTEPFESPGGNTLTAINLDPIAITQANLDVVIDADWIDEETLCQGVESGTVDACP